MGARRNLPIGYLNECFICLSEEGVLVWRQRPKSHFPTEIGWARTNGKCAGKQAGALTVSTRRGLLVHRWIVSVEEHPYAVHRIIWAMVHGLDLGDVPEYLDHEDTDATNNKIGNLRPATREQNGHNRGKNQNNTTGFKGVTFRASLGRYTAEISADHARHKLGWFDTAEEAGRAYAEAAVRLHGNFARVE